MAVTPNTEVRLLSVPFSNDYKDIMDFDSKADQTAYMLSKVKHAYSDFNYQRQERSLKVPSNIDGLLDCNYVMYQNNEYYPDKWFYAFITAKRYVNPHTTELDIETDVFQTWQFDLNYKDSFIERSHVDRWNVDGSPRTNTVDEGLDYGSEYSIINVDHFHPSNDILFLVIACKKQLHFPNEVNPVKNGTVQPLSFYIHPFYKLTGGTPPTKIGGVTVPLGTIQSLLHEIYTDDAAVNNVVSLYITDYIGFDVNFNGTVNLDGSPFQDRTISKTGTAGSTHIIYVQDNQLGYETTSKTFNDKYSNYQTVTESKLLMYPYTVLTLSDGKGNQVNLKNEYINGSDLKIVARGSIGTANKTAYYIDGYLQPPDETNGHVTNLEHAIICKESNDVPIITDLLSAYLQGNRNALATQKAQITFNQKMDTLGGVAGMVSGAGGSPMSLHQSPQEFASSGLGALSSIVSGGLSTLQTRGNHQLQTAALMARQKDIQNTPPSISNMGDNTYFDYGNDINGVYLIKKQIRPEYINKLTDYFKMYGYKLNEVQQPDFKSRQHFNYIKTVGINIQGNVPADEMNAIKGIFNNGVTVWHVDDIGNYSLVNNEVS